MLQRKSLQTRQLAYGIITGAARMVTNPTGAHGPALLICAEGAESWVGWVVTFDVVKIMVGPTSRDRGYGIVDCDKRKKP